MNDVIINQSPNSGNCRIEGSNITVTTNRSNVAGSGIEPFMIWAFGNS